MTIKFKFFACSPFETLVKPSWDASSVHVTGDGVQPHGVLASLPVSFDVDTRHAGKAQLDVVITVSTVCWLM